ncbi:MAG: hypothetical protein K1X72_26320 [Pyrinomonadaceae bacterium]|nr:hypothetical protein [Pyrinomonadaceae bacterium]
MNSWNAVLPADKHRANDVKGFEKFYLNYSRSALNANWKRGVPFAKYLRK